MEGFPTKDCGVGPEKPGGRSDSSASHRQACRMPLIKSWALGSAAEDSAGPTATRQNLLQLFRSKLNQALILLLPLRLGQQPCQWPWAKKNSHPLSPPFPSGHKITQQASHFCFVFKVCSFSKRKVAPSKLLSFVI